MREHAEDFTQNDRPAPTPTRRVRPNALMSTGLGLAAVAVVLVLVLGAGTAPRAFAVTRNHDGTVTVRILGRTGIAGANTRLHELGIRAKVVVTQAQAGCAVLPAAGQGPRTSQPGFVDANWTIDPGRVPAGKTLLLTARGSSDSGSGNSGATGNSGTDGDGAGGWVTLSCPNVPVPSGTDPPSETGNSGNPSTSGNS